MRRFARKDRPTGESTSVWCSSREAHEELFETLVSYREKICPSGNR